MEFIQSCISSTTGAVDAERLRGLLSERQVAPLTKMAISKGELTSGSLVEFRGMVQDMFDPELFCLSYVDANDGATKSGLFRDSFPSSWKPMPEKLAERDVVYLVPVPAEMPWFRKLHGNGNSDEMSLTGEDNFGQTEKKRERIDQENDSDVSMKQNDIPSSTMAKRIRSEHNGETESSKPVFRMDANLPLPSESKDIPCMIKLYDRFMSYTALKGERRLQLQDVVRVIGFLSLDHIDDDSNEFFGDQIETRDCLPASVAPRLHVIDIQFDSSPVMASNLPSSALDQARAMVSRVLATSLGGDALAAEFVLLWLVSSACRTSGDILLGKVTLALTRLQQGWPIKHLYEALELLLPRVQTATIADLSAFNFAPEKDMDANRMRAGRLQMAPGTRFVFDESALGPMTMSSKALKSVQAITRLAENQTVAYDFTYYATELKVDAPVAVITSNSKPCLIQQGVDCCVPLVVSGSTPSMVQGFSSLKDADLHVMRVYLERARELSKTIVFDQETCNKAEQDFVALRRMPGSTIDDKDLHLWLNLTKLTAASLGATATNPSHYARARMVDDERRKRVAASN